jgi:hypothetical protein
MLPPDADQRSIAFLILQGEHWPGSIPTLHNSGMIMRLVKSTIKRKSVSTAVMAFLALEGLTLMEKSGLFSWPDAERKQLIEKIRELVTPSEGESCAGHKKTTHA